MAQPSTDQYESRVALWEDPHNSGAAAEPLVYEVVTATFDCGGHAFTAKGKQVLSQGWRAIQEVFRSSLKEKPEDGDAVGVLPALTEGQVFESVAASVTEHFTSPPSPTRRTPFCRPWRMRARKICRTRQNARAWAPRRPGRPSLKSWCPAGSWSARART